MNETSRLEVLMQKLINDEPIEDWESLSRLEEHLVNCIKGTGRDGLGLPLNRYEELLQILSLKMKNQGEVNKNHEERITKNEEDIKYLKTDIKGQPQLLTLSEIQALTTNVGLVVEYEGNKTKNIWKFENGEYADSGVLYSQTTIANGSITPVKTTFFNKEKSTNLLDLSKVIKGAIASNGKFYDYDKKVTDFIPVNAGDIVTYQLRAADIWNLKAITYIACYNADKTIMPNLIEDYTKEITVPEGVAYLRLTIENYMVVPSDKPSVVKTNVILTPETYEPYYINYVLDNQYLKIDDVVNTQIGKAIKPNPTNATKKMTAININNEKFDISMGTQTIKPYLMEGYEPSNVFLQERILYKEGYYAIIKNGKINYAANPRYNVYLIPISNAKYVTSKINFFLIVDENIEYVSNTYQTDVTEFTNSQNGAYAMISILNDFETTPYNFEFTKDSFAFLSGNEVKLPEWVMKSNRKVNIKKENYNNMITSVRFGDIFSGTFKVLQDDFILRMGWNNSPSFSGIKVDKTNWYLYERDRVVVTKAHYLTINTNDLLGVQVESVQTAEDPRGWKILINVNDTEYKYSFTWSFGKIGYPYSDIVNGEKISFSFYNKLIDNAKSIIFGDSYLEMVDTRWAYYMIKNNHRNPVYNSFSGENSNDATLDFIRVISNFKIPEYIVWCMGMNDGTDSADAPSAKWLDNVKKVISACLKLNTTLILATIPSVPSINHEQKNKFVRESGFRYIDFAKAVNAQPNGTWGNGLLSSDNIHPSKAGALMLYSQVLSDFPEITKE